MLEKVKEESNGNELERSFQNKSTLRRQRSKRDKGKMKERFIEFTKRKGKGGKRETDEMMNLETEREKEQTTEEKRGNKYS